MPAKSVHSANVNLPVTSGRPSSKGGRAADSGAQSPPTRGPPAVCWPLIEQTMEEELIRTLLLWALCSQFPERRGEWHKHIWRWEKTPLQARIRSMSPNIDDRRSSSCTFCLALQVHRYTDETTAHSQGISTPFCSEHCKEVGSSPRGGGGQLPQGLGIVTLRS
jgi:hypothetical protein